MKKWIKVFAISTLIISLIGWWSSITYYESPNAFIHFCKDKIDKQKKQYERIVQYADTLKGGNVPYVFIVNDRAQELTFNILRDDSIQRMVNLPLGQDLPPEVKYFVLYEKLYTLGKDIDGRVKFEFRGHQLLFTDKYVLVYSSIPINQTQWAKDYKRINKNTFYYSSKWIYLLSDNWAACSE